MPNHLANETSPYLLQHADNPVDWYPWGDEALNRARKENKPILLSIGYSACHWCHVMAHESFENQSTARLMNQYFINIKVDREERPDLDSIYMESVQAMTGGGGWPLTVFLTPEGKPFFGGTYFPPDDRQDIPGFPKVLQAIADAYRNNRGELDRTSGELVSALKQRIRAGSKAETLTDDILKIAYDTIKQHYDPKNGGFGRTPKFPQAMVLEFSMRYSRRFHFIHALRMVEFTLDKMCRGGIYDQLGGGFHRYATDERWLVPHFEKMLYDNALLSQIYLSAYLFTGKPLYRSITEGTLNYVLREMTSTEGGFYSSQDADSEGVEGKYYVWTDKEVNDVVGSDAAETVGRYFGITSEGNFEGKNILSVVDVSSTDLSVIETAKVTLLKKREQRVRPGRDEKILASWNGLMLKGFAEAGCALGNQAYLATAVANGNFLVNKMVVAGKLKHSYKDGNATVDGFLLDYAAVIEGLLSLHQATLQSEWLVHAIKLGEMMIEKFWDSQNALLFDATLEQKDLFVRPRHIFDDAVPSGASTACLAMLKLARITENELFRQVAVQSLQSVAELMQKYPLGLSNWLCALDFYLSQAKDIIIVGSKDEAATLELLETVCSKWLPDKVVIAYDPGAPSPISDLKLLENRQMIAGKTTVYVCEGSSCKNPVSDVDSLKTIL